MPISRAAVSELIEMIYHASLEPGIWPSIVQRLSDIYRGTGTLFVYDSTSRGLTMEITQGFDEKFIDSYKNYYVSTDLLVDQALLVPDDQVSHLFDLAEKNTFENSEFYTDWLRPQRLYQCMGTRIRVDGTTSMFATFHRSQGDRDFSATELGALSQLVPHLKRAADIGARLGKQAGLATATAAALDHLGVAAFLLTRDGVVSDLNAEAQRMVESETFMRLQLGRLVPAESEQIAGFRHTLKQVVDRHIGDTIVIRTFRGEVLQGLVVPVATSSVWLGGAQRQALLLIKANGEQSARAGDFMQEAFRLTLAERRLLDALMSGKTLSEFCEIHQISRNTAKTHLQNLFQKTGTSRQAALVRMASQSTMI